MAKMMTKSQIAGHLANKFEITKKQSTQILEELGPEAVVTRQREGVVGGIGGFFAASAPVFGEHAAASKIPMTGSDRSANFQPLEIHRA